MIVLQYFLLTLFSAIFIIIAAYFFSQIWIDFFNARFKRKYGLPYVPTSRKRLRRILEFAEIKPGDRVIDLGSGDGRMVIAAAKAGAQADGYELNPVLVWWSRLKIRMAGLGDRATIYQKDLLKADLAKYNVFLIYGMPWVLDEIENRLENTEHERIRIVSNTFKFENLEPAKIAEKEKIYLYEFQKSANRQLEKIS
jgi:hypothetical protein